MTQKILISNKTLHKDYDKSLLTGISHYMGGFQNHKEIAKALKGKGPYTVTVIVDNLKYEYRNRKEFVKKTKYPVESKYRALLYSEFFKEYGEREGNKIYGKWLSKYNDRHLKEKKYKSVDEYIIKYELTSRYKAKILSLFKNRQELFKTRFRIDRKRYYKLPEPFTWVDYRNPYDNIFIWKEAGKKVTIRGGSGSSDGRERNSIFILGLLELNKTEPVPSYLFLYSEANELWFIKKFESLCVPDYDIGSNYFLEDEEQKQIMKGNIFLEWKDFDKVKEVKIFTE